MLTGATHTEMHGCLPRRPVGFPNASGTHPAENGMIPEMLSASAAGNTYWSASGTLTDDRDDVALDAAVTLAVPGRGFERWYGSSGRRPISGIRT